MRAWLWWRVRLAVGWALKRTGCCLLDAGWALIDRAARDYRSEFRRYERNLRSE